MIILTLHDDFRRVVCKAIKKGVRCVRADGHANECDFFKACGASGDGHRGACIVRKGHPGKCSSKVWE